MSADLISGRLGGDTFPAQVLGRQHRHYPAPDSATDSFTHLLTWQDLNQLIATQRLNSPRLRLSAGESIDVGRYTQRRRYRRMPDWDAPVPHQFHRQLREGATLVVDAIDEMHPPIGETVAGLETWLGTGIQTNAYASWTPKEGFGIHWDDHDVLVLQVSGRKRWRIYGTTRTAPLHNDVEFDEDPPTEPIDEFVMAPGDILHVPRGCWHAVAASEGEPSLHLTCGLNTTTGADFLTWLTAGMAEHEEVRADIPRDPGQFSNWSHRMSELITARLQAPAVVSEYWERQNETATARAAFSLPVAVTGEFTDSTRLRLATKRGTLSITANSVIYLSQGRRWTFATQAAPLLTHLNGQHSATVKELCQLVPDISRDTLIGLLRRLLEDGALVWEGDEG
ncbi:cupin domain-containing protein [Nocardiopsis exhalans]|uniref:Cupin domain-containing protein n=1 Tax=Nocardiopsis exhalans TaxID=163604 RepID=A0ABY5D425_9ACTN|nr:cupin domain-containing protein [Nocardiopsis exhalans]USY19126.1 cupin domain-containing protein [Nocardiopsis exhalans]